MTALTAASGDVEDFGVLKEFASRSFLIWVGFILMVLVVFFWEIEENIPFHTFTLVVVAVFGWVIVVEALLLPGKIGTTKTLPFLMCILVPGIWFLVRNTLWYKKLEDGWREGVRREKFDEISQKVEEILKGSAFSNQDSHLELRRLFLSMEKRLFESSSWTKKWVRKFAEVIEKELYRDACLMTKERLLECGIALVADTGFGAAQLLISVGIKIPKSDSVQRVMEDYYQGITEIENAVTAIMDAWREGRLGSYAAIQSLFQL